MQQRTRVLVTAQLVFVGAPKGLKFSKMHGFGNKKTHYHLSPRNKIKTKSPCLKGGLGDQDPIFCDTQHIEHGTQHRHLWSGNHPLFGVTRTWWTFPAVYGPTNLDHPRYRK